MGTYRRLPLEGLSTDSFRDRPVLVVEGGVLEQLATAAFNDLAHLFRPSHLQQLQAILSDPLASDNDRFVALQQLKNAVTAAERVLPACQDTGTALVYGRKGAQIWTIGDDQSALSQGIARSYHDLNLRYSQLVPLTLFEEQNSGTNLPAQIDIEAVSGGRYEFLFMAKGGGSANKTFLYQQTKALLNPKTLHHFLAQELPKIGTSACPPYHLAIVIGGTSAEATLKMVKLAAARYLDATLATSGDSSGRPFRDLAMEAEVLEITRQIGFGAQFGGRHFAHDVRVIRLPRHGASCPVGIGVSCSADRHITAYIDRRGVWLEALETEPARYLPQPSGIAEKSLAVPLNLNQPMAILRAELSRHRVSTRFSLSGSLIVARDIAHARLYELMQQGEPLPSYFKNHPIYYAGPAKTPAGYAAGSFGPTTAGRMDGYMEAFQRQGASLITLAKGNRSPSVTAACHRYGGFYLGSIGGVAAELTQRHIKKMELIAFPELGMEAIYRIEVEEFPAFLIIDDKGNDFYTSVLS